MSADLDTTNVKPAIALAATGGKAWHGFGDLLAEGASIEDWRHSSGLMYEVLPKTVYYKDPLSVSDSPEFLPYADRFVLTRSDNGIPLSVVSKKYQLVQPETVMEFFRDLTEANHFTMESAGALNEGRRIWALAKTNKAADVLKGDEHRGYVLLATSFDGGLATTAKFTDIRVVCQNTLTQALRGSGGVKVPHNSEFSAEKVKSQLGIATEQFGEFIEVQKQLLTIKMNAQKVEDVLAAILAPASKKEEYQRSAEQVKAGKAYKKIMGLFEGEAKGSDIPGVRGTAYGLLQATTEYFDHHVFARTEQSRMASSWFGTGEQFKAKALESLIALI